MADANKASSEENANGVTSVYELSQRTLVFMVAHILGPGGLQQASKYLWAIQFLLGGLLPAGCCSLDS